MATRDEILRFVIKTEGGQELAGLAREIGQVGDASGEAEKQANALLEEFGNAGRLQQVADRYRELGRSVLSYENQIRSAKDEVARLGREISAAAKPTRDQQSAFSAAKRELDRLTAAQDKNRSTLRGLRADLEANGVSVRNLVRGQQDLAARGAQAERSLRQLADSTRQAREESSRAAAAAAAEQAATNRSVQAKARARVSLDEYKRSAEAARNSNQQLGASVDGVGAKFGKLRGLIAGAFAGFSIAGIAQGVKGILTLGDAAERTEKQLARLFGSKEAGASAFAQLKKIAAETSLPIDGVRDAAIKLKAFGIDPLNGSLQALIDENAAMGGSQERLEGTILAVGQAWAKQKLQGEEILQLVERGVPVWDILQKVTGKNVAELQKLSEAGKLGRQEIGALLAEIGRLNSGAAAEGANTLSGLFTKLVGKVREFATEIANSGALNSFKESLRGIIAQINELANSGKLAQYAKSVSDALSTLAKVLFETTKFAIEHASAIVNLGIAYASFKAASFVAEIGRAAAAMIGWRAAATGASAALGTTATASAAAATSAGTASTALGLLGRALSLIRANPIIAALSVAIGAVTVKVVELIDVNEQLADTEAAVERQRKLNLAKINFLIQAGKDYKDTIVLQSQEVERLTGVEATAYQQRLKRAEGYYRALESFARMAGDAVGLKDAKDNLAEIVPALAAVEKKLVDIEEQAKRAKSRFGEFATEAGNAFDTAVAKGEKARDEIRKLFTDTDLTNPAGFNKLAEAITVVGSRGREAGRILQDELRQQLIKLSDADLQKFRAQADAAFAAGVKGSAQMKAALEGINLARLGVDIAAIKNGFTESGNAAVNAFAAAVREIKQAGLTAEQQSIATAQAFDAAFKSASTSKELEGLKRALEGAFKAGEIAADKYAERVSQINAQIAKQTASSNLFKPQTDGLQQMGAAAQQTAGEVKSIGESSEQSGKKTDDFARRGTSLLSGLTNEIAGVRSEFAALSDAAAKAFDDTFKNASRAFTSVGADLGFAAIRDAMRTAQQEVNESVQKQRDALASLTASLTQYAETGTSAFNGVAQSAQFSVSGLDSLTVAIESGTGAFDLLGRQELGPLQAAIDAARAKTLALQQQAEQAIESIRNTSQSIQDEIDRIRGNEEAIEQRNHERRLQQIRDEAALAGEAGSATASEAIARANELHALRLQQIAEQKAAERERQRESANSQSTTPTQPTPRPNTGGGGGSIVNTFNFNGLVLTGTQDQVADQLSRIVAPALSRLSRRGGG